MNIFISGGCKNGKSHYAQELAQKMAQEGNLPLYYLATMIPHDDEDNARIRRHLFERAGWGFDTIEQGVNICGALNAKTVSGETVDPRGVFLLDSVTALLSNEMFHEDGTTDFDAPKRLAEELTHFARETGNTVFVSDYIYSDSFAFDDFTEPYRQGLALLDFDVVEAHAKDGVDFVTIHAVAGRGSSFRKTFIVFARCRKVQANLRRPWTGKFSNLLWLRLRS